MKVFQRTPAVWRGFVTRTCYASAINPRKTAIGGPERLDEDEAPRPQRAPLDITPGLSSEAALDHLLRACVAEIDQHLAVFMDSDDESGPHKTRVALRRLTTVLDGFRPLFRRAVWRPLRAEAKAMFRELGRVRDAQVLLSGLEDETRRAKLAVDLVPLRDKVRRRLRQRGAVAFGATLLRRLAAGELLRAKTRGLARRAQPVDDLAGRAMDGLHRSCRALGHDLSALSVTDLHEFRKRMKSLRYLAEFFAPLWQHPDWPALRRDLQDLQDALGALNDQANARRRGIEVSQAKADRAMKAAQKLWSRLAEAPAWWRDRQVS